MTEPIFRSPSLPPPHRPEPPVPVRSRSHENLGATGRADVVHLSESSGSSLPHGSTIKHVLDAPGIRHNRPRAKSLRDGSAPFNQPTSKEKKIQFHENAFNDAVEENSPTLSDAVKRPLDLIHKAQA
jgi:hypothetical protein